MPGEQVLVAAGDTCAHTSPTSPLAIGERAGSVRAPPDEVAPSAMMTGLVSLTLVIVGPRAADDSGRATPGEVVVAAGDASPLTIGGRADGVRAPPDEVIPPAMMTGLVSPAAVVIGPRADGGRLGDVSVRVVFDSRAASAFDIARAAGVGADSARTTGDSAECVGDCCVAGAMSCLIHPGTPPSPIREGSRDRGAPGRPIVNELLLALSGVPCIGERESD